MTEQESREQFEAWYQQSGISPWLVKFNREPDGKYSFVGTENDWRVWQGSREMMNGQEQQK